MNINHPISQLVVMTTPQYRGENCDTRTGNRGCHVTDQGQATLRYIICVTLSIFPLPAFENGKVPQMKWTMEKKEMKIEYNYKSQSEIHTVAARAAPEDLSLKSHPQNYQQKLAY